MIDESERSGRWFHPTQASVEIKGVMQRYRIASSASTYALMQHLDRDRVIAAYGLLYGGKVEPIISEALRRTPTSLGAFWRTLHEIALFEQIGDVQNVIIEEMRFDKYDQKMGSTRHTPEVHRNQDLLFIPLPKEDMTVRHVVDTFPKEWDRPYVVVADSFFHYLRG